MDNRGFLCCFCDQQFALLQEIRQHIQNVHQLERNQGRRCGINNCQAVFRNPQSLRSHRSRVHRPAAINVHEFPDIERHNELGGVNIVNVPFPNQLRADNLRRNDDHVQVEAEVIEEVDSDPSSDEEADEETDEDDDNDADEVQNDIGINDERKHALGRFLLNLRGNTNISEAKISYILIMLQEVVKIYISSAFNRAEQILQRQGINLRQHFNVQNEVQSTDCTFDLGNKKKRMEYLETEFEVLMPIRHTLGRRFIKYGSAALGEDRPVKRKNDEMIFIPITKIFQKFAKNNSFHDTFKYNDSQDGVYASVEDGNRYKNQNWWKDRDEAMHIKLYSDEVEMCDGLGSKASVHQKLLMIYCSFTDFDPIYQSSLLFNFLVAIVKAEDVKRYGMMRILRPVVDDIKVFQEGIDCPNDTQQEGGLFAIVGDNLSQHCMCGLKESFGRTLHLCRFCLLSLDEVHTATEENLQELRNPVSHDRQVAEIENAVDQEKENLMTAYGINRRSVLNELNGFHVTEGTPPDIMHDILLGLLPKTLQHFAQKVILRKMSLKKLNELILNFDYGYSETKYKPSPLKSKHLIPGANIKQNAMQMATLAYIIPYIVRDVVDSDCLYFYNYRNLLEIMNIVFAYTISSEMIQFLGDSIAEYLHDYAVLYGDDDGNETFIPKQHFLTHYPRLITIFGPLRNFMCLRFEAKHQESKRRTDGMRNYTNLPYTLAVRHQLSQALQLLEPLTKTTIRGPTKFVATDTLPFNNFFPEEPLQCITNWITYNGIKYIPKNCLLVVGYNDCLPRFLALDRIVVRNTDNIFMCKKVQTVEYNTELIAYEVNVNEEFVALNPENLVNHEIYHTRKYRSKLYVTVKHGLGDLY